MTAPRSAEQELDVSRTSMASARSRGEELPSQRNATHDVIARGAISDVHGEHSRKGAWTRFENLHGAPAKARVAAHQEHQTRHHGGTAKQAAMIRLIAREIIEGEAIGQQRGLAKSQAEAFSGDGVDAARGVADESSVPAVDAPQSSARGNRAALAGGAFGVSDAGGKFGKVGERLIES